MDVIQKICERVAVKEDGKIIEAGSVLNLFTTPNHTTTKKFVNSLFEERLSSSFLKSYQSEGKTIKLSFVGGSSKDPALAMVSKKFNVFPNILSGHITQLKEHAYGRLIVHLQGEQPEIKKALHYITEEGLIVEEIYLLCLLVCALFYYNFVYFF